MNLVSSLASVLSMVGLAMVVGCASAPPPAAATATLAAAVEVTPPAESAVSTQAEPEVAPAPVAEPVKHEVEIMVDHLPPASSFHKDATTYVFWVRASDEDAWTNATHLDPSKGAEKTTFGFAQDVLFVHVTAETDADARVPSDKVVLSTRVSRNGACASGVDQNDVTMKVRMCH